MQSFFIILLQKQWTLYNDFSLKLMHAAQVDGQVEHKVCDLKGHLKILRSFLNYKIIFLGAQRINPPPPTKNVQAILSTE